MAEAGGGVRGGDAVEGRAEGAVRRLGRAGGHPARRSSASTLAQVGSIGLGAAPPKVGEHDGRQREEPERSSNSRAAGVSWAPRSCITSAASGLARQLGWKDLLS